MFGDIEKHAGARRARELKTENPPAVFKVGRKTVRLPPHEVAQQKADNIAYNKTVRKDIDAEIRRRKSARLDNLNNNQSAVGGETKSASPDVQYSDAPAPFCARMSERAKSRWVMVLVFLPVIVIAVFALLADAL